jgi:nucleotide-binding universal stress UspA family protein
VADEGAEPGAGEEVATMNEESPSGRRAVIAALDASDHDAGVAAWAAAEALRAGVPLRLVTVVDAGLQLSPYEAMAAGAPGLAEQVDADTRRHLSEVARRVREAHPGLEVDVDVPWGSPAAGLVVASRTGRLLVMGSPAHSGFGSVVVPVMAHAECPVVVLPPDGAEARRPRHVVVGVDGSEPSRRALDVAVGLLEPEGGSATCVVAWRTEVEAEMLLTYAMAEAVPEVDARYADLLDEVVGEVAPQHPQVQLTPLVRHGNTPSVLVDVAAEEDADLIVIGSRGHGGFVGLLLGSVSRRVVSRADRPVVVVH